MIRERLDKRAADLRGRAVGPSRRALLGQIAAKTWLERGPIRGALVDMALLASARLVLGAGATLGEGPFFPVVYLPAYHGPHFRRAVRRLLVPGEGPFVLHLSLTGACPWTCRYCFASAGGPDAPDVGADAILEVARALARQRVPIVILGGGEPLGRFQRALEIVRILAHASEVRLATSGAGLTPARAAALRDAGLGVLAISLDGADRGRVDRVRGAGAYDTATRALGVAAEAGLPTLVTCVVGRESLPEEADVEKFLALVRSLHQGAAVGFLPEFAAGRGSGFRNPAAYRTTGARISRAIRRGRHRAATFYGAPMDQLVGCVGQRQLVVDIEGNLGACVSGCSFGNVVREPFDAVWARMLATLTRFKQGWFCAHPGDAPADEALRAFHAETEDAWLQRAVDGLGPILPWLVPG